jgi:rRNA maturation RNase YbeY
LISFTNETAYLLPTKKIEKELVRWLPYLAKHHKKKIGDVNIAFLKPSSIKVLEKRYFGKNKVTDILTFPSDDHRLAGDIGICLHQVLKDARRDGADANEYLCEIFLHGFLHLCGLEHDYKKASLLAVYELHREWIKKMKVDPQLFSLIK